jgi:hypothetical protein
MVYKPIIILKRIDLRASFSLLTHSMGVPIYEVSDHQAATGRAIKWSREFKDGHPWHPGDLPNEVGGHKDRVAPQPGLEGIFVSGM